MQIHSHAWRVLSNINIWSLWAESKWNRQKGFRLVYGTDREKSNFRLYLDENWRKRAFLFRRTR